jgi:putative iron-only hydrogenase system regulator
VKQNDEEKMDKRIGTITIIITNRTSQAENINRILSEFGDVIIGRMGIPYSPKDLHIIALIVHASTDEIGSLTGKLGTLTGVQVKSALTKA